jgi:hypothetical protein
MRASCNVSKLLESRHPASFTPHMRASCNGYGKERFDSESLSHRTRAGLAAPTRNANRSLTGIGCKLEWRQFFCDAFCGLHFVVCRTRKYSRNVYTDYYV